MALDPLTAGLDLAHALIDAIVSRIPDPQERERQRAALEAAAAANQAAQVMAQLDVNKAEAASASLFVAGWRPGAGWVCVAGLAYQFLAVPLLPWILTVCGAHVPPLPQLDDTLWQLVAGMLGLGGLRSWEKARGVATTAVPTRGQGARP